MILTTNKSRSNISSHAFVRTRARTQEKRKPDITSHFRASSEIVRVSGWFDKKAIVVETLRGPGKSFENVLRTFLQSERPSQHAHLQNEPGIENEMARFIIDLAHTALPSEEERFIQGVLVYAEDRQGATEMHFDYHVDDDLMMMNAAFNTFEAGKSLKLPGQLQKSHFAIHPTTDGKYAIALRRYGDQSAIYPIAMELGLASIDTHQLQPFTRTEKPKPPPAPILKRKVTLYRTKMDRAIQIIFNLSGLCGIIAPFLFLKWYWALGTVYATTFILNYLKHRILAIHHAMMGRIRETFE